MNSSRTILLTGIPGSCKTTFGRFFADHYGFAHYDLEHHPTGWPRPELKISHWDPIFAAESSKQISAVRAFLDSMKASHPRVVLDWGFPPSYLWLAQALGTCGVTLVWFDAPIEMARRLYTIRERGEQKCLSAFEHQVSQIDAAGLPTRDFLKIRTLHADGSQTPGEDILKMIEASWEN